MFITLFIRVYFGDFGGKENKFVSSFAANSSLFF